MSFVALKGLISPEYIQMDIKEPPLSLVWLLIRSNFQRTRARNALQGLLRSQPYHDLERPFCDLESVRDLGRVPACLFLYVFRY